MHVGAGLEGREVMPCIGQGWRLGAGGRCDAAGRDGDGKNNDQLQEV